MYAGLRLYGWMGAAYGAVVSAVLSFLIIYLVLHRTIGVKLTAVFRYAASAYPEMISLLKKTGSKDN
jgi:hypothetical protein